MAKVPLKIDKIVRSSRKTLSLIVEKDAKLIVRAPMKMTGQVILSFVEKKRDWIVAKQDEARNRIEKHEEIKSGLEDKVLYLGNYYPLVEMENYKYALNFDKVSFLIESSYYLHSKKLLELWYRRQAVKVIHERTQHFSKLSGLTFLNFKINGANRRWGSCSQKKSLNFSWRLILAPLSVVDYVVVHELAHTKEMNHSAKFWNLVEQILPDYKKELRWLKTNGYTLDL